ncbi:MAG: hypothetical protein LBF41_00480 [Deltaproteobacteria bacterium]|jgi:hypothetical protein|nr:hypothetical protein [Deltaproteobacteria bacterium]
MRAENSNNYNPLGRMGPLYQRPEYHPPKKNPAGTGADNGVKGEGDKKETPKDTLSLSQKIKGKETAKKQDPSQKMNLQAAKNLTAETCGEIAELSPGSTEGCPHKMLLGGVFVYPMYA